MEFDETSVRRALWKSWSLDSAKQWTADRPFEGQCNVTAAVVFDLFGGDILRTKVPGYSVDHYYNRINGVVVDLTDKQFAEPFDYDDEVSDKTSAMNILYDGEYDALRTALVENLDQSQST